MNRNFALALIVSLGLHCVLFLMPRITIQPNPVKDPTITFEMNSSEINQTEAVNLGTDLGNRIKAMANQPTASEIPGNPNGFQDSVVHNNTNPTTDIAELNIHEKSSGIKTGKKSADTQVDKSTHQNSIPDITNSINTHVNQESDSQDNGGLSEKSPPSDSEEFNTGQTSNAGKDMNTNSSSQSGPNQGADPESQTEPADNARVNETDNESSEAKEKQAQQAAIKSFTSAVNRACNAAKTYPEALQSQGVSGRVTLILSFTQSGLGSVSVSSSNGSSELDRAAIEAVQRARLPSVPEVLRTRLPIKVRITLSYKLNK